MFKYNIFELCILIAIAYLILNVGVNTYPFTIYLSGVVAFILFYNAVVTRLDSYYSNTFYKISESPFNCIIYERKVYVDTSPKESSLREILKEIFYPPITSSFIMMLLLIGCLGAGISAFKLPNTTYIAPITAIWFFYSYCFLAFLIVEIGIPLMLNTHYKEFLKYKDSELSLNKFSFKYLRKVKDTVNNILLTSLKLFVPVTLIEFLITIECFYKGITPPEILWLLVVNYFAMIGILIGTFLSMLISLYTTIAFKQKSISESEYHSIAGEDIFDKLGVREGSNEFKTFIVFVLMVIQVGIGVYFFKLDYLLVAYIYILAVLSQTILTFSFRYDLK